MKRDTEIIQAFYKGVESQYNNSQEELFENISLILSDILEGKRKRFDKKQKKEVYIIESKIEKLEKEKKEITDLKEEDDKKLNKVKSRINSLLEFINKEKNKLEDLISGDITTKKLLENDELLNCFNKTSSDIKKLKEEKNRLKDEIKGYKYNKEIKIINSEVTDENTLLENTKNKDIIITKQFIEKIRNRLKEIISQKAKELPELWKNSTKIDQNIFEGIGTSSRLGGKINSNEDSTNKPEQEFSKLDNLILILLQKNIEIENMEIIDSNNVFQIYIAQLNKTMLISDEETEKGFRYATFIIPGNIDEIDQNTKGVKIKFRSPSEWKHEINDSLKAKNKSSIFNNYIFQSKKANGNRSKNGYGKLITNPEEIKKILNKEFEYDTLNIVSYKEFAYEYNKTTDKKGKKLKTDIYSLAKILKVPAKIGYIKKTIFEDDYKFEKDETYYNNTYAGFENNYPELSKELNTYKTFDDINTSEFLKDLEGIEAYSLCTNLGGLGGSEQKLYIGLLIKRYIGIKNEENISELDREINEIEKDGIDKHIQKKKAEENIAKNEKIKEDIDIAMETISERLVNIFFDPNGENTVIECGIEIDGTTTPYYFTAKSITDKEIGIRKIKKGLTNIYKRLQDSKQEFIKQAQEEKQIITKEELLVGFMINVLKEVFGGGGENNKTLDTIARGIIQESGLNKPEILSLFDINKIK